jgi:hypothetical protein
MASTIPLGSRGRGVAAGPFDELAAFETGAGGDERDQMGRVYGAPAGLGRSDELERHRQPGGPRAGTLVTLVRCLTVAKVGFIPG